MWKWIYRDNYNEIRDPPFGLPKPDLRIRTRIRERFYFKEKFKKTIGTDHEFKLSYHGGIK